MGAREGDGPKWKREEWSLDISCTPVVLFIQK